MGVGLEIQPLCPCHSWRAVWVKEGPAICVVAGAPGTAGYSGTCFTLVCLARPFFLSLMVWCVLSTADTCKGGPTQSWRHLCAQVSE